MIKIGDNCKDCLTILTLLNTVVSKGYINNRCRDCYNKQYNRKPEKARKQNLERRFGITLEEYNKKLELQLNGCAICKELCKEQENLGVDHNHFTNEVRDLLCARCNRVLGSINEDEDILINMIEYLKKHSEKVA